jgi:hypothetical protein
MIRLYSRAAAALITLMLVFAPAVSKGSGVTQSWDFSVRLDGDTIGYHRFELIKDGEQRRLRSEAKFDVRILFINAFRYRHDATELWADGCLREIEARTQANGKQLAVIGTTVEDRLVVDAGAETKALDYCVMTFAYWNPDFLRQPRLLDSQSGEYLDVEVQNIGQESISVRGQTVDASVYRLTAKQLEIRLWYSSDDEWLALESVAKGGRIIRYELS